MLLQLEMDIDKADQHFQHAPQSVIDAHLKERWTKEFTKAVFPMAPFALVKGAPGNVTRYRSGICILAESQLNHTLDMLKILKGVSPERDNIIDAIREELLNR